MKWKELKEKIESYKDFDDETEVDAKIFERPISISVEVIEMELVLEITKRLSI